MILVTGAARSGTSLITSMLGACGANLGADKDINDLYENLFLRENMLKPLLTFYGGDPRGQSHFPKTSKENPPAELDIEEKFIQAGLTGHTGTVDVYKDAKLIILWEVFQREIDNLEWLIVRRDPEQIIDSCLRTPFMNTFNTKEGWREWVYHHEQRIIDLKENCCNWEEIWTEDVINDPESIRGLVEWYGLEWNTTEVDMLIDPNKFRT